MDFLITGVDVSFGFDWVLNDRFMFTFQVVPQFNYYIFLKESFQDPYGEYHSAVNYADFKLEDGILLKNENGYFALIGEMCEPQWLEEKSSVLDSSFGETESDELDFEMM